VLAGCLLVLLAAALRDRRNRLLHTGRPTPSQPSQLNPSGSHSDRHPPTQRVVRPLSKADAGELDSLLSDESVSRFPIAPLDPRFLTHRVPDRIIAQHPLVLVCDEAPAGSREIVPVFQLARRLERPLMVLAPEPSTAELADTLAVNHRMQILDVALLSLADGDVADLAATLQITPLSRGELQAGGVTVEQLGQPRTAVAEGETLHLVN